MAENNKLKDYYDDFKRIFARGPIGKRKIAHKLAAPGQPGVPVGTAQAFLKNVNSSFASTMASYGQYNRLARFSDYNEMETMAEIGSALDIFADEITAQGDDGQIIKIHSPNKQIREALEDLFYDNLNLTFEARRWIRNLCKYGDQYLLLDHHPDYGILNVFPLPVNEIEREEGYDPKNPTEYRFRWITQGNRILEKWEVVHFRLGGNDNFLPYGASLLESARRTWRQLILLEDAVMVYRIVRSPERRVFKIDVGNIEPKDVPAFMEKAKSQLKRNQIVDSTSGRVDMRYNPLSVDEDYFIPVRGDRSSEISSLPGGQYPVRKDSIIPLLDGRKITIEQLAKEYDEGKENWVYSVQNSTSKTVPGKVIWCGKNYTCSNIHRLWLDDGSYIDMAPEHPVVLRDGSLKRADNLKEGESLMPFRSKLSTGKIKGYEQICDPIDDVWRLTHRIVANEIHNRDEAHLRSGETSLAIHHIDCNKRNNLPSNLKFMGFWEHRELHKTLLSKTLHSKETKEKNVERIKSKENRKKLSIAANNPNGKWYKWIHSEENKNRLRIRNITEESKQQTSERNRARWKNNEFREQHSGENHWNVKKWQNLYKKYTLNDLKEFCLSNNIFTFKDLIVYKNGLLNSKAQYRKFLNFYGISTWREFSKNYLSLQKNNHKVLRVEVIADIDDVYCMTVVGPNGEEDRHNFAILSKGIEVPFGCMNGIFIKNTGDIEDLKYTQGKLFAALKIPKSYLGYEEDLGNKATLSQLDVRFAKTIQRIQREFIAELNKMAVIHLYTMGIQGEELNNFDIEMANPSVVSELQKLELIRTKLEIASVVPQNGIVDKQFVYSNILKIPAEFVETIEEGRRKDRLIDLEIENMQAPQEFEPESEAGGVAPGVVGNNPTASGLPAEPQPLAAGRDPNMQVGIPNELILKNPQKNKKDKLPNLKNYAFNQKKTGNDHKRNSSELTRFVKAPFGESSDETVKEAEERVFKQYKSVVNKVAEELENSSISTKKKTILND